MFKRAQKIYLALALISLIPLFLFTDGFYTLFVPVYLVTVFLIYMALPFLINFRATKTIISFVLSLIQSLVIAKFDSFISMRFESGLIKALMNLSPNEIYLIKIQFVFFFISLLATFSQVDRNESRKDKKLCK